MHDFFVAEAPASRNYLFMQDAPGSPKDGKVKILVVDDTESVADLMREMLHSFDYAADISLVVNQALAEFAPGKYDLVITDYLMPRMNGVEFARALKQKAPGQRVLLITGSTFPTTESSSQPLPVEFTLQKPFSVEEFQQAVESVLKMPLSFVNQAATQAAPAEFRLQ